ncbi:hypothetical protein [Spiroplasma endosymbiont of Cleonymus obscurus]|uniref:hypothetical protein n=1 Tax=Spiroplasma endosymbiont of Cleonymus obscurus TaxID=3066324 RepID=UPI0037DD15A2
MKTELIWTSTLQNKDTQIIKKPRIFWIIVNIFQIAMYSGVAHNRLDVNLLLMWIVALGNSGFGFYQWFFVRSKEKVVVKKETYEQ